MITLTRLAGNGRAHWFELRCDTTGCDERLNVPDGWTYGARDKARAHGWTTSLAERVGALIPARIDHCPKHGRTA